MKIFKNRSSKFEMKAGITFVKLFLKMLCRHIFEEFESIERTIC